MRRDRERGLMAAEGAEKSLVVGGVIVHPHDFFAAQEAVRGSSQYRRTSYTKFPAFWLALLSVPLRLVQLEIALAGCRHHLIETQDLRGARIQ